MPDDVPPFSVTAVVPVCNGASVTCYPAFVGGLYRKVAGVQFILLEEMEVPQALSVLVLTFTDLIALVTT